MIRGSITIGALALLPASAFAIMAGDEFGAPVDMPSLRVDAAGATSVYNFVGALGIDAGVSNYFGSG